MAGMAERWDVKLGDGGLIVVWVEGDGPPLVLVHGSLSDHTTFEPLAGELRDEFTVFAMDRRGFGASLESPNYSAEREFSDVAAVAARSRRGPGSRWCCSAIHGARAAHSVPARISVATSPRPLRAQLGPAVPPGAIDRIEERVAAGDNEGAVIETLTGILTEDEIAERRAAPNWPERIATAP
jgi:hypothetical protein